MKENRKVKCMDENTWRVNQPIEATEKVEYNVDTGSNATQSRSDQEKANTKNFSFSS